MSGRMKLSRSNRLQQIQRKNFALSGRETDCTSKQTSVFHETQKFVMHAEALYDRIKQTAFLTMTTKLMLCMEK